MEVSKHLLDQLYPNNSLLLLETMIPYVDPSLRLPLALFIKIQELQMIINTLQQPNALKACGYSESPNKDELIFSLLNTMGYDVGEQLKQVQAFQSMMNMPQASGQSEASNNHEIHTTSDSEINPTSNNQIDNFSNTKEEFISAIHDILDQQDNQI